ncbi:MAG: nucleotidyltransferase family protein [Candidatus Acidiferrum sp.]
MPGRRLAAEAHLTEKPAIGAGTFSAEWALVVECARTNPDKERLKDLLRAPLDWPRALDLAEKHSVVGLVAMRLQELGEASIPPEIFQVLRERQREQVLFTLRLTAEMFRLFDCFAAAGLAALVTKGPVLSQRSYGDPGSRQYGDLDLIARDKDMLRATELMTGLDYLPRVPLASIQAKKAPGEYAFRHASTRLLVEFHTEVTFRYHPRQLPVEKLFERQTREKIDGREIPALSPEDELVLICIHGGKHFWEQLSYIADVAAFVSRQQLDWRRVTAAADEVGARRMLLVGLRLAAHVLDAPLPEELARVVQTDPAVTRLTKQIVRWLPAAGSAPPGIFERALFRMRMRGGAVSSLPYLLRLSFSPTEDDWVEGAENKRHWFLDALRRPIRLARKYGRASKS